MPKKTIKWKCLKDKCKRTCCGTFDKQVKLFNKNYCSVNKVSNREILITKDDIEKIKRMKKGQYFKKIGSEHYIKLKRDGSCPYLLKGLCSIYEVRPMLCKSYPFYIDLSAGLIIDKDCPGVGKGITKIKDLKQYLDPLMDLYDEQMVNLIVNEDL